MIVNGNVKEIHMMKSIGIHNDRVKEHNNNLLVHRERGNVPLPLDQSTTIDLMPSCFVARTSMKVGVEVVLLAEFVREGDASDQFAPVALDGVDVEEHHEARKQTDKHQQEDDDLAAFAVQVHAAKADVGQEGEGQEEAGDEATDVGEVVDPGQ